MHAHLTTECVISRLTKFISHRLNIKLIVLNLLRQTWVLWIRKEIYHFVRNSIQNFYSPLAPLAPPTYDPSIDVSIDAISLRGGIAHSESLKRWWGDAPYKVAGPRRRYASVPLASSTDDRASRRAPLFFPIFSKFRNRIALITKGKPFPYLVTRS